MVRAGKWPTLQGVTLENKKLGILGFGRIGRELAGIARQGFRMEIHYRNVKRLPPELEQGAIYHDNDEDFLRAIDFLSMHAATPITTAYRSSAVRQYRSAYPVQPRPAA